MDFRGGTMAKMTIKGMDELALSLSKLGTMSADITNKVIMAGAKPVADEIRKSLTSKLSGAKYSTGDLLDSFGIAPTEVDNNGNTNTKIGFDGYGAHSKKSKKRPKGTANAIKARVMESGSSNQKKKPFVRPAVNRSKDKAIKAMSDKFDEEIKKMVK